MEPSTYYVSMLTECLEFEKTVENIGDKEEEKYCPFVRYAHYDEEKGHLDQWYDLHSVHDPIPDEAQFASGIYLLTEGEKRRLRDRIDRGIEVWS